MWWGGGRGEGEGVFIVRVLVSFRGSHAGIVKREVCDFNDITVDDLRNRRLIVWGFRRLTKKNLQYVK